MPTGTETCQELSCSVKGRGFPYSGWHISLKYATDFVIALVLFVLLFPLMAVTGLLVWFTSGRPIIYSQTRRGRNGVSFQIYKLRTMLHNCETLTGPCWSTPGDPRITPVGRFLRKTHLDELPQLWNVLRGEMSLVGPRPERPEFAIELSKKIAHYGERLVIRPGVTGLAQVQLPGDTDLTSVKRKLAYDLYYVKNLNPWLDVRIILSTCFKVLGVPFSQLRQWFALPSFKMVEYHFERHFSWPQKGNQETGYPYTATITMVECAGSVSTVVAQGGTPTKAPPLAEALPVPAKPGL
jgi:lipopolysaccharide/colanic/teichoic acid biosynthesis glycosyltransferase